MSFYNNNISFGEGADIKNADNADNENDRVTISDKKWTTTLVLAIFLGSIGAHRFYVGKTGSGVLMIFLSPVTLFIWPLIDLIKIATGKFRDAQDRLIIEENRT